MGKSAQELRAYVEGLDPVTGRPVMQEIIEGLTTGLAGLNMALFERTTPRLVEPTPKTICNGCSSKTIGRAAPDRPADGKARRRHAQAARGRRRWSAIRPVNSCGVGMPKVAVNAVMAGAEPYFPGHPGARRLASDGAQQHVEFRLGDGRRQRSDPRRDRHGCRHRRHGSLDSAPIDDRPNPLAARQFVDRGGFDTKAKLITAGS